MTADHLGSPRIITDDDKDVVSRHDYLAFGDEVTETVGNVAGRTSGQGYGEDDEIRKQYTGYERDKESGLDFAQARYYNSNHGRFTSVDPMTASASIRNPQTFNRYSYVLNSPYKFTDPLGLIASSTGACGTACANVQGGGYTGGIGWDKTTNRGSVYLGHYTYVPKKQQKQKKKETPPPAAAEQNPEQVEEKTTAEERDLIRGWVEDMFAAGSITGDGTVTIIEPVPGLIDEVTNESISALERAKQTRDNVSEILSVDVKRQNAAGSNDLGSTTGLFNGSDDNISDSYDLGSTTGLFSKPSDDAKNYVSAVLGSNGAARRDAAYKISTKYGSKTFKGISNKSGDNITTSYNQGALRTQLEYLFRQVDDLAY